MIEHMLRRAKGGSMIVTCTGFDDPAKVPPLQRILSIFLSLTSLTPAVRTI